MNFFSVTDLIGTAASLSALVFLFLGAKKGTWKPEMILFAFIVILSFSHEAGNFLEWGGISNWFGPVEDYLEVLGAALWAFFLYTFLQELTETQLRAVQELDEKILDGSPVAFVLRDADLRIIRVSKAFEKVTGYKSEEAIGKNNLEFIPDINGRSELNARLREALEKGEPVGPTEVKAPTPFPRYIREKIIPVADKKGSYTNTLSVLEDITEQKSARDALKESEARYRMLFNNIQDGVALYEIDREDRFGCFIEVNTSFCIMTGYNKSELLGMTPYDLVNIEQYKDSGTVHLNLIEGHDVFFEGVLTKKSGEKISCELNSHPLFMKGRPLIFTVIRDVSERKETEDRIKHSLAEKEMLLQEIHHRVKNNLQVISGLLNLQSLFIGDEKIRSIFKDSQNRIKTMALIHEELYQREDLARINMADYIEGLAHNLMNSYSISKDRINLKMDLEDFDVAIDTAIPCGLIVNELVSNALAHAFPGDMRGEISIKFRSRKANLYEFTIGDNGVGLPSGLDIRHTKTLGLRLVTLLSEQLGADLLVERDNGTTFQLVFGEYHEVGTGMH